MRKFALYVIYVFLAIVVGIPVMFFGFGGFAGALVYHLLADDRPFFEHFFFSILCWAAWLIFLSFVLNL